MAKVSEKQLNNEWSVKVYAQLERKTLHSCPGFPSVGHAILTAIYVSVNVILSFVHLDYDKTNYYAARFGWMATANFAFIVFLALKNTPLAFLTKYSYERLNYLHRVAGYTTVLFMLLHTAAYIRHEFAQNKLFKLLEIDNVCGIIAGCAMFVIALTALLFMERTYELFYVAHITLFMVATIATGLHRPEWIDRIPIVMIMIAVTWTLDRLTRFSWMVARSVNNEARLELLPNGGTKVTLKKPLKRAAPGSHCFLWIPRAQLFETHPFTIVSNGPSGLELVAKAHDGFTKSLHELAQTEKGQEANLFASVDGPYGTCPNPASYEKLVLVVGGTGATFAFGMIMDLLQRSEADANPQVHLVWAVKHIDDIAWASEHIKTLHAYGPRVSLAINVTQEQPPASNSDEDGTNPLPLDLTQYFSVYGSAESTPSPTGEKRQALNENSSPTDVGAGWALMYQKLKVDKVLTDLVAGADSHQRMLIGVCGPSGMTAASRDVVSTLMQPSGPSIDLHCESFGW
ncbi:ferric reductase transmembrane component 5 [Pestalotiopsis sp. NC0098]|nr:ferric reductase transmembrane component 5 [Pestalotiopsis sp. NC0098]